MLCISEHYDPTICVGLLLIVYGEQEYYTLAHLDMLVPATYQEQNYKKGNYVYF